MKIILTLATCTALFAIIFAAGFVSIENRKVSVDSYIAGAAILVSLSMTITVAAVNYRAGRLSLKKALLLIVLFVPILLVNLFIVRSLHKVSKDKSVADSSINGGKK